MTQLALSTLGLPNHSLEQAADLAAEHGLTGLELRCAPGQPVDTDLSDAARARAARVLADRGLTALSVAGYIGIAAPGSDELILAALHDQLRLAADIGAAGVRVFPQGGDHGPAADLRAVRRLAAVAPYAAELGVRVLVETHDSHSGGRDLARVLSQVDHPAVGALWDSMHTWLAGESVGETHAALAPWLAYVQVKDIAGHNDRTPLALGAGVLPLAELLRALPAACWVSWEYEAPWYPEAAALPDLLGSGATLLRELRG